MRVSTFRMYPRSRHIWDRSTMLVSCPQPPRQAVPGSQAVFPVVHTPYYRYERLK